MFSPNCNKLDSRIPKGPKLLDQKAVINELSKRIRDKLILYHASSSEIEIKFVKTLPFLFSIHENFKLNSEIKS